MDKFYKILPYFIVFVFAIIASFSLFGQGFFPMHDDEQIARLFDLNLAIEEGQIPPRISPNLGFGYGYPFFNFYPSFAYYVGEVFHLFGFGYILSTKLMLFSGFFLSALFMYILAKDFFGKNGGLVAAAAYTFAPYHAVDIYVRGAFAEFYSFVFLPPIFWALHKIYKENKGKYFFPLALSIAGLVMSHNLIAFMAIPFIAIWGAYFLWQAKDKWTFIKWSFIGVILGFGLSAFFFVPSYLERGFTLVRILTGELADYNLHFVCVRQLWDMPWGYGGSIPNCEDGLSFMIGKVHILLSLITIVMSCYFYFIKKSTKNSILVFVLGLMLFISIFLSIRQSKPIWDAIFPLSYVQFPWRYLTLMTFFSSLLVAYVVSVFTKKQMIVALILVGILIVANFQYFRPREIINVNDDYYVGQEKIRWETSSLAYEYVPDGIATKTSKFGTTMIDIDRDEIKKSSYEIISGEAKVDVITDKSHDKEFKIDTNGGTIRLNTFSFPGWKVKIDNNVVNFTDKNKLKLIDVELPPGRYTLTARFEDTNVRFFGNLVSILSIILVSVLILKTRHEKA